MRCRCLVKEEGFTLVEIIVVISVFIIVLMISTYAFNSVLTISNNITKNGESSIDGVVDLKMFRPGLTQAGFWLINAFDPIIAEPAYDEVDHETIEQ